MDSFVVTELKTKAFLSLVGGLTDEKKKVLIVGRFDETTYKAGRNVKAVQLTTADQVNTENLLHYNKILITREALDEVAARTAAADRKPAAATPVL